MSVKVSNYESSYWYIYYKSNSSNIPTEQNCYASIYSQTTFFVHILSTFNSVVCESGYYGLNCNQECSMFCKNSRDCHPMSGYCKEGCKIGWQGLDCLEGVYFFKFIIFIKVKEARYTKTVCLYQTGIKQEKKIHINVWYAHDAYNSNKELFIFI